MGLIMLTRERNLFDEMPVASRLSDFRKRPVRQDRLDILFQYRGPFKSPRVHTRQSLRQCCLSFGTVVLTPHQYRHSGVIGEIGRLSKYLSCANSLLKGQRWWKISISQTFAPGPSAITLFSHPCAGPDACCVQI